MPDQVRNYEESRLPERDSKGRVRQADCVVVEASIMLPAGTKVTDVQALMERLFDREISVLHWTTNWLSVHREEGKG